VRGPRSEARRKLRTIESFNAHFSFAWPAPKKVTCTLRNVRSGELVMEENSLPKGESPNEIPMPDAASAFVYITFLPSPFGPAMRLGFVLGREITIPSMDGPMAPITV